MPTLETLTKSDLKGPLKSKSLRRARGYVSRVQNPARSGHTLTAQVRGSRLYEVEIDVEPGGISAICSCPYDWGGYCKHIGAVLLRWIQSPGDFAVAGAAATISNEYSIDVTPVEPPPTQRLEQPPFWLAFPFTDGSSSPLSGWRSPSLSASAPTKNSCANGSTGSGCKICA
ncbi:MAG: hypothetical protein B6I35_09890 [Anaerolineaceae bacterium 4572_32.2]|nr:MAG: hypothetical protein B6I35_09890 [Anaerolineaceae bacterium 4572_32.2]